jgi:hypothetical protein
MNQKVRGFLFVMASALGATASAAPITSAAFSPAPASPATDPTSFSRITVDGVDYTSFTYGTASGTAGQDQYFYTPQDDPGGELAALGGSVVTDGVLNIQENTKIRFGRAITADEVIFITDLETSSDTVRDDDLGLGLLDSNGNVIVGTATVFSNIGSGGSNLLTFDAVGSNGASLSGAKLYGAAFKLSDFGYSGTAAHGIYFSSSQALDPSIAGLAAVPEPASAALIALAAPALLARRRRR